MKAPLLTLLLVALCGSASAQLRGLLQTQTCALTYMRPTRLAADSDPLLVHTRFTQHLGLLNNYAAACGVQMIARGSYRPHTIVPGASIDRNQRDDVFAGHAVFLWLRTPVPDAPGTWETCNTACMDQVRASPDTANRAAKCFIDRVTAASPFIRWGGALPGADSTRFDGFLVNTPALWEQYAVESKISFDSGCFARAPMVPPGDGPHLGMSCTMPGLGGWARCALIGDCQGRTDRAHKGTCGGSRLVVCCLKGLPMSVMSSTEAGEAMPAAPAVLIDELVAATP